MLKVLILGTCILVCCGAVKFDEEIQKKIDELVEVLLGCRELVSINLAVVEENDVHITKGYGFSNLDTQENSTGKTLYGVASLSKAFASTLLGHVLEENGNYTWDTPVREILGDDFYFSSWDLTEHATLRDLLSHKMGIPPNNMARMQDGLDREMLSKKIRFFNQTLEYRQSYLYNNLMYGLISYITEVIGGSSWEELMRMHIFEPLGMNSSSFTHETSEEEAEKFLAVPYLPDENGEWRRVTHFLHSEWGKVGGSGSITSNAEDMAKWLLFQLSAEDNSMTKEGVSAEVVLDTCTRMNIIPHGTDDVLYRRPNSPVSYIMDEYAMGWRRGYYRGYTMVLHTGTSYGYGALLTQIPDTKIGIYTGISGPDSGYRARRALHMYIIDLLAGVEPFLNTSNVCTFPDTKTRRKLVKLDESTLSNIENNSSLYEGEYGNFGYGNISVIFNDSTQGLQLVYGVLGLWDLYPSEGNHTFSAKGLEHTWSMYYDDIVFDHYNEANGSMDRVTIPFEWRDPPAFYRGLTMDQAPSPDEGPCSNL